MSWLSEAPRQLTGSANVTSQSNFPIVAALERQRSLPEKKAPKKAKKAETILARGPSKPRQTKLDIDALFTGFSYKPSAKPPPKAIAPSSDTSDSLDLTAALDKEAIKKYGHIPKHLSPGTASSRGSTSAPIRPRTSPSSPRGECSPAAAHAEPVDFQGSAEVIDLRRSPLVSGVQHNTPPQLGSQDLDYTVVSPKSVEIVRPVALRPNDVRRLESLAAVEPFPAAGLPRRLRSQPRPNDNHAERECTLIELT